MTIGYTLGERVHIDWWRVITDLERAGVSHPKIQAALGRSWGWVNYLKDTPGAEPKAPEAFALIQLWMHHAGKTEMPWREDAPRFQLSGIPAPRN